MTPRSLDIPITNQKKELNQIQRIAELMDGKNFPIGLDPLIGLFPVIGDLIPIVASLYIISAADRIGLPKDKIRQIVMLTVVDVVIGLVPVAGDFSDFFIRSHYRSWQIIRDHFEA